MYGKRNKLHILIENGKKPWILIYMAQKEFYVDLQAEEGNAKKKKKTSRQ